MIILRPSWQPQTGVERIAPVGGAIRPAFGGHRSDVATVLSDENVKLYQGGGHN